MKLGIGWRPEIALAISRREDLSFVEVLAENYLKLDRLPDSLLALKEKGVEIIPHCISLSPGGSRQPDRERIKRIDRFAKTCGAKIVSDHLCFVRAGGLESGHLLPVPRDKATKKVIVDNIKFIKENLSVPFALENIAAVCDWENQGYDEASYFAEILEESDCRMLLDLSNLYANSTNHKFDPIQYLQKLPLDRLEYVHIAGGTFRNQLYHDTHAHPVINEVYSLLKTLSAMVPLSKIMLERDDRFPCEIELNRELDLIKSVGAGPCPDQPVEPTPPHKAENYSQTSTPRFLSSRLSQESQAMKLNRISLETQERELIKCLVQSHPAPKDIDVLKAREAAIALHEKKLRQKQKCKGQFNEYLWQFH